MTLRTKAEHQDLASTVKTLAELALLLSTAIYSASAIP
jgi:hypothetical protein